MLSGITAYSNGKKYTGAIATVNGPSPSVSISNDGTITANVSNPKGYQSSATTKEATYQLNTKGATTITPSNSRQTAVSSGVYTTGDIVVSAVPTETKSITANGTYTPSSGKYFSSVEVDIASDVPTYQSKTVTPTTSAQTITADSGYDALSDVTVNAIQTETKSITSNGTYNPTSGKYFSSVIVDIPSETFNTQTKTVTPTESTQTISPDNGYDGLSSVTVNPISSTYVGSGVTRKSAATITPSESVQRIAANQYLTGVQTISAIPSDYVGSGVTRKSAATITPTESEQVIPSGQYLEGTQTISAIPSNYVGSGVKTKGATTISPSTSIQTVVSAGTYVTGDIKVSAMTRGELKTPTINSSGLITAGVKTSGYLDTSKTSTLQLTTKSATTFTPTTTNQTINAGQYLTGAQTIQGDANLIPANIASGVSIFGVTGTHQGGGGTDTSDATATQADIVNGKTAYINGGKVTGTLIVQNYYTGTTTPESTIGEDGDLYFKVVR